MKPTYKRDIGGGAKAGLAFGAAFTGWATFVFIMHGDAAFANHHLTYASTIGLYLGGGLVSGAIVGALKPLARYDIGVAVIGVVAAIPALLGFTIATQGVSAFAKWDKQDVYFFVIGVLLFGLVGALIYLDYRNSLNPPDSAVKSHRGRH